MRNEDLALCQCAHDVWGGISRKPLEIQTWVQRTTNRKWTIASPMVTWLMTSRDPARSRSWPQYAEGPVSRKRLEIETWWQWSTYRKLQPGNRMLTWPMTSRPWMVNVVTPICLVSIISKMAGDRDSMTGVPIEYGYLWIKWSRDLWPHVTLKGQGRDLSAFRGQYHAKCWRSISSTFRDRLCSKGSPIGIGNVLWQVEWSLARWCHVSYLLIRNWLHIVICHSTFRIEKIA